MKKRLILEGLVWVVSLQNWMTCKWRRRTLPNSSRYMPWRGKSKKKQKKKREYPFAKLAGQYVAVDAGGLLVSTLQVVLLPVLASAFLNQYFQGLVRLVSPLMPPIAVETVAILCGNAIAQNSAAILMSGKQVVLAVCLLHASGFFFSYMLARILGVDKSSTRTISIEVGMQYLVQNSVLGVVLASQHFSNPLTVVPCVVSSVCHSIFGSVLASFWRQSVNDTS